MPAATLRVKGYRETARALAAVDKGAKRTLYAALREAARPVADDAKQRLSRYPGISLATIKPGARVGGVYVRQGAKKVNGLHPDFGSLQMRVGLLPALARNEAGTFRRVEQAFDVLIRAEGF